MTQPSNRLAMRARGASRGLVASPSGNGPNRSANLPFRDDPLLAIGLGLDPVLTDPMLGRKEPHDLESVARAGDGEPRKELHQLPEFEFVLCHVSFSFGWRQGAEAAPRGRKPVRGESNSIEQPQAGGANLAVDAARQFVPYRL